MPLVAGHETTHLQPLFQPLLSSLQSLPACLCKKNHDHLSSTAACCCKLLLLLLLLGQLDPKQVSSSASRPLVPQVRASMLTPDGAQPGPQPCSDNMQLSSEPAGTTGDMIFRPWIQRMEALGARFHFGTAVRDFQLDPVSGRVTRVTAASKGGPPQVCLLPKTSNTA